MKPAAAAELRIGDQVAKRSDKSPYPRIYRVVELLPQLEDQVVLRAGDGSTISVKRRTLKKV